MLKKPNQITMKMLMGFTILVNVLIICRAASTLSNSTTTTSKTVTKSSTVRMSTAAETTNQPITVKKAAQSTNVIIGKCHLVYVMHLFDISIYFVRI